MMRWGLLVMASGFASLGWAHDIEARVEFASPAVIVRTTYGGTDPAAFVEVLVYSPANPGTEFQNGRTDARGAFSFVPDRGGDWLFVADDELGHRIELKVPVEQSLLEGRTQAGSAGMGTTQKALTGVAFILGATGLLFWWRTRQTLHRDTT
jgi:nickel transport protein